MKKNLSFIVFAAAVLLVLAVLSSGKKPPLIPSDAAHSVVTTESGCIGCHGQGRTAPLKPSHPPKEQCLVCHKTRL